MMLAGRVDNQTAMAAAQLSDEDREHLQAFHEAVNMTASELEKWLVTEESKNVGQKISENAESTGHESGRHIVQLLRTKQEDLQSADVHQMQRVVSYVHRHMAQRPSGGVSETRWRYSLMNWGHDPLKSERH